MKKIQILLLKGKADRVFADFKALVQRYGSMTLGEIANYPERLI